MSDSAETSSSTSPSAIAERHARRHLPAGIGGGAPRQRGVRLGQRLERDDPAAIAPARAASRRTGRHWRRRRARRRSRSARAPRPAAPRAALPSCAGSDRSPGGAPGAAGASCGRRQGEDLDRPRDAGQAMLPERAELAPQAHSLAKASEIRMLGPSVRHRPSRRDARLTAGPITVKSSRSAAPMLPYITSPTCSAMPKPSASSPRARRSSLSAAIAARASSAACSGARGRPARSSSGKIASMASPMNFRISPPWRSTGAGHAVEDTRSGRRAPRRGRALGQRGEAAQIAVPDRRAARVSPLPRVICALEDALAGAVADIGVEQVDRDAPIEVDLQQQAEHRQQVLDLRQILAARSRPAGRTPRSVPWILPSLKVIGSAT